MKSDDLVELMICCDDLKQDTKSLTGIVKDLAKAVNHGKKFDGDYLFPSIIKDFESCENKIEIIKEILIENDLI